MASSAVVTSIAAPGLLRANCDAPTSGKFSIGVISDVHQDIMHDGVERITAFVAAMTEQKVDSIYNLGDFCVPKDANLPFLAAWDKFAGPRYHVLGNHDMDGGYKREQTVEYYKIPARYYSFDRQGVHFVVLDGNDPDGKTKGYQRYVAPDQQKWLAEDLAATKLPTVVMIHQPIDAYDMNVVNSAEIRAILDKANQEAGFTKVLAVFSGHAHLDYVKETDGISHIQINSASYQWVNKSHKSYSDELHKKHPYLALVCPYADPLWATVTFDFEQGQITLTGRESTWVGGSPWEIGLKEDDYGRNKEICRPAITGRTIALAKKS